MKKSHYLPIFIGLFLFAHHLWGQEDQLTISGTIINKETQATVPNAFIELFKAQDSLMIDFVKTDLEGTYTFDEVAPNTYFLRVSHPEYGVTLTPSIVVTHSLENQTFTLTENNYELDEVVITKNKPITTLEGNKMNIDVTRIPGTEGNNSMELLSKLPGVWVENEETIKLNGSNDVTILINGKKQGFSTAQNVNLLKTISADNIKKVEIIAGGSAKYDATGGSVINIITKNKTFDGLSASITSAVLVNEKVSNNNNVFVSIASGKLSALGSFSYGHTNNYFDETSTTSYNATTANATLQNTLSDYQSKTNAYSFYTNIGYTFNPHHEVDVNVSSYSTNADSYINQQSTYTGSNNFMLHYRNDKNIKDNLTSANLNYTYTIDTIGTLLKANAAYLNGYIKENQLFNNQYSFNTAPDSVNLGTGNIPLDGEQFIGKLDVEIPVDSYTFEFGGKYTHMNLENYVTYHNIENNVEILDSNRSDSLTYKEKVWAAYGMITKKMGPFSITAGARMEHTSYNSKYLSYNTLATNEYTNVLPNIALSYRTRDFSTTLKFTSGITRPNYTYLNPYQYYINDFTYREGNPNLRPLKRNTITLQNALWDFLDISVGYHRYNDMIYAVNKQTNDGLYTVIRPENAASINDLFANISVYFLLLDNKWRGQLSFYGETYNYDIKDEFLTSDEDLDQFTYFTARFNNGYKITPKLEVFNNLSYRSNANFYQIYQKSRWRLDLGMTYKMLKDKLKVTLAVDDVFDGYNYENRSYYNNYERTYTTNLSLTRFRFALNYNFDMGWKKTKSSNKNENQEEVNRFKTE